MAVKPENEPVYFFAVHPRGTQKYWVEKFEQIFEDPIPTATCPQTFIECVIDEGDREGFPISFDEDQVVNEGYPYTFNQTRFHFGHDVVDEDLPLIMNKMKNHVLTTNLQVAIFEDKLDRQILNQLGTDRLEEYLERRMFPRLLKSMSFVRDVERAVEAISIIKNIDYDPDVIHMSVSIDANDCTPEWIDKLAAWDVGGLLTDGLQQLAKIYGRPNWVIGADGDDKDEDDECFHLTIFFAPERICIGIEVLEDKDFHPYLATNIQTIDGGLASLVARFIRPEKTDFVFEIGMQNCDVAMATLYEYECFYYIATPVIQDLENTMATYRSVKEEVVRRGGNTYTREFQIIKYSDLSQIQECDLLYLADRIVIYADFHPGITNAQEYVAFLDGILDYVWRGNPLSLFTIVVPIHHKDSIMSYLQENKNLTVMKQVSTITATEYVTIMELAHVSYNFVQYNKMLDAGFHPVYI